MTKIKLPNGTKETLGLAGASVGFGLIGEGLGSTALSSAGTAASGFISPMVNISMGGFMIKQLRGLGKIGKK